jgi:single stranded DNA-binding protein
MKARIEVGGYVGNDAKLKEINGKSVCQFSLSSSETIRKAGEKQYETLWFNCSIWNKYGEVMAPVIKKGTKCKIAGKFTVTESVSKDGAISTYNNILVDTIFMADTKSRDNKDDNFIDDEIPF